MAAIWDSIHNLSLIHISMPQGYHTVLDNEAANLSVGQRQLITIARVFLCNPPIIILDEATSSVDTRTEAEIGKAMKKLMNGRTSFVIAHRLSTIRDADNILFMENGNIIEQGNHCLLYTSTLAHKAVEIGSANLSNSKRKKISRYAILDLESDSYTVSAFLIAQFGKNYAVDEGKGINGNELMDLTFEILEKVQDVYKRQD